jgi:succinoglycan biosynthesis protein ExoL
MMLDPIRETTAASGSGWMPRKVAYLGFDASHTSVRKRMEQIGDRTQLIGLTFRRPRYNSDFVPNWDNIDLGHLQNGNYLKRLPMLVRALNIMRANKARLAGTELVIARNLDLLSLAIAARRIGLFDAPIVYDVFDVRDVLLGRSTTAKVMRAAEKLAMKQSALLVVSSPGFVEDYFTPYLHYDGPTLFLENKVDLEILPDDPAVRAAWASPDRARSGLDGDRLTIGWVGALRCARSARMLIEIARALPWIDVRISGKSSYCPPDEFAAQFAGIDNIRYTGEYWFPTGLYDVYRHVDLNWDFDLSKPNKSGGWLLPNRLYEGGYFGVPHLAEQGSQTGHYVDRLGIGWTRPADVGAIIDLLSGIRADYAPVKQRCLELMNSAFHDQGEINKLFQLVAAGR